MPGTILLSQRDVRKLVIVQSTLVFLQYIGGASVLGDLFPSKYVALFIIVIAGAQQGVNFFIGKSVGESVQHFETAMGRAETVVAQAQEATVQAHVATALAKEATKEAGT